ncbi:MAG: hypothetical protein GX575_00175 [Candidatus Anammoximicrobium sp.]|nr:hypothetical protein [Candidatus Anammoximicrobium sp.]
MSNRRKHRPRRRPARPEDAFMVLSGQIKNIATACEVHQTDAADDRRWLAAHPEADARHRMATAREMAAYGLPPGCTVVVQRGPLGSQVRLIYPPQK